MKKSERILLTITAGVGILALIYVYVVEPNATAGSINSNEEKYLDILNRQPEIQQQARQFFAPGLWKSSRAEQQMALQSHIEQLSRASGITHIKSILPLSTDASMNDSVDLGLQMDVESSIDSLSRLIYSIGSSTMPLQVQEAHIFSETGNPSTVRAQLVIASLWINTSPEQTTQK